MVSRLPRLRLEFNELPQSDVWGAIQRGWPRAVTLGLIWIIKGIHLYQMQSHQKKWTKRLRTCPHLMRMSWRELISLHGANDWWHNDLWMHGRMIQHVSSATLFFPMTLWECINKRWIIENKLRVFWQLWPNTRICDVLTVIGEDAFLVTLRQGDSSQFFTMT